MNQLSTVGLGKDATVLAGYALAANDRLGNIDFVLENTGDNDAYVVLKELIGSGYQNVGSAITLVPKGVKTVSLTLVSAQLGFFGSGNTTINISTVLRHPANLRGAQVDFVITGRSGWGYDAAYNKGAFLPVIGS